MDPSRDPNAANVGEGAPKESPGAQRSWLGDAIGFVKSVGQDLFNLAAGRAAPAPAEPAVPPPTADAPASEKRATMLGAVANRLRGAADTYIAAKLDELEARVDAKLDTIEQRIDRKVLDLHEQLIRMRDQELRHRLRLLRLTLIFTVLVAALSLVYKLVVRWLEL